MTRTARDPAAQMIYEAGNRIVGRYLVRERLGAGPLGVVLRADDVATGAQVAIKLIWPELTGDDAARGRFAATATAARSIGNRFVVGVSDVFIDVVRGVPVCGLVSTLMRRPTLAAQLEERVKNSEPMLALEAQPIVSQIGVGLSAIHAAGLVHGNLKARNIFCPEDQLHIADVGVAAGLPPDVVAHAQASLGRDTGRAPEASAGAPWGRAGDVYSFAVIVGQMMGMFPPNQDYEVPTAISDVVWRALAEDPRERFPDVDAFAAALLTTFERGERHSPVGLRAVAPALPRHDSPVLGSGGESVAALTGALDGRLRDKEMMSQPTPVRRAPSVLVDSSVESLTPITQLPLPTPHRPPRADAIPVPMRPDVTTAAPVPVRVRVPFPLILLLMFATASLALAILYNVVDMRFDAQIAEKAPALKRRPAERITAPKVERLPAVAIPPAKPRAVAAPDDAGPPRSDDKEGPLADPRPNDRTAAPVAPAAPISPAARPAKVPPICGPGTRRTSDGATSCISAYEYPSARVLPRVKVTLAQARALCAERGQRLCRQAEWEAACRGNDGFAYPYGPASIRESCNTGSRGGMLAKTGSFRRCQTPSGAFDMAGNVGEWVEEGVVKGGDAHTRATDARCGLTRVVPPTLKSPTTGFRCCADLR